MKYTNEELNEYIYDAIPISKAMERFESSFQRFGKARINLESKIENGGSILAQFNGSFVLISRNPK